MASNRTAPEGTGEPLDLDANPGSQVGDPPGDSASIPGSAGPDAELTDVPVGKDTRSVFAAALERKKQAGQARSAHLDGHGGVGGATASHKTSRTFRRKSG